MKLMMAVMTSLAATALAFSVAAFVIADRAESSTPSVPTRPNGSAATQVPQVATVDVELGDLYIRPQQINVNTNDSLVLNVHNAGAIPHDLKLEGGDGTRMLNPAETQNLRLGQLAAGEYTVFCTVPGHREGGMVATITVSEGATTGGVAGRMLHDDDEYMAGVLAFPAETQGMGGQPLEPVIVDGVKVFELTAEEIMWETEPGVFREAMAYNGQVPGPEIRVQLGDTVRVILHNQLPESSSIHFHGLVLPYTEDGVPGLTQPIVTAGMSWTYEFEVRNAGSHMYHSHMNGAVQIPMGLLGAFIVEDGTEEPVDQDITMILNDGPLGYTINGKGFPATQPIVAAQGERIRIRYMNEGLQIHPMHLHGMPQLVVARDGYPLPQPYMADTITVAPGERIDVIVDATEVGLWAFHCHILTHAEGPHGMFGMVTVMIVTE